MITVVTRDVDCVDVLCTVVLGVLDVDGVWVVEETVVVDGIVDVVVTVLGVTVVVLTVVDGVWVVEVLWVVDCVIVLLWVVVD